MTSKERVLAAARRQRTDRPPTGLRCTAEAWEALRTHLGVGTNEEVLDTLDVDLRIVGVPFIGPEERSTPTLAGEGKEFWGVEHVEVDTPTDAYYEF